MARRTSRRTARSTVRQCVALTCGKGMSMKRTTDVRQNSSNASNDALGRTFLTQMCFALEMCCFVPPVPSVRVACSLLTRLRLFSASGTSDDFARDLLPERRLTRRPERDAHVAPCSGGGKATIKWNSHRDAEFGQAKRWSAKLFRNEQSLQDYGGTINAGKYDK